MIYFLSFIALAAVNGFATSHALLVGVSDYDVTTGWNKINGADDVSLLESLLKEYGFDVVSLVDREATRRNVLQNLDRLVKRAKKGDLIYIHFSCHGQPVEDISGDESDKWDEALVLYGAYKEYGDRGYKGENHMIDDTLYKYMVKLQNKVGVGGMIYVVLDACHSGSGIRDPKDVRGTNTGFCYSTGGMNYKPDKNQESKRYYRLSRTKAQGDIVVLEACRSFENNHEVTIDKNHPVVGGQMKRTGKYGSLSYHIYKVLHSKGLSKDTSWVKSVKQSMDSDPFLKTKRQSMVVESTLQVN